MDKELTFSKYLMNEAKFGVTPRKDVVDTVDGHLDSAKNRAMTVIRDRLNHVHRIGDHEEIADAVNRELSRMNREFVAEFTQWINTRKW